MSCGERHFGPARRFIAALIALFSFTLQTYVVQTHFHAPRFEVSGFSQVNHPSPPANKDNQDDCPFCQAVAHGSTFFLPATALFLIPAAWIELAVPILGLRVTFDVAAYDWKSRAPPKA